jgi:hypothetical protein
MMQCTFGLGPGHRHTGTACALCASADVSGQVTAQKLDSDNLAALLDKTSWGYNLFPLIYHSAVDLDASLLH